jgi:hypothetical protein
MRSLILFTLLTGLALTAKAQTMDLDRLVTWMAGSYNSQAQHLRDTANYFDIRLQMVPIWKERSDGHWFYVEQAVADFIDKPYRQRVYRVHELEPGVFESIIYTVQDPLRFTHHPELLEQLPVDSLNEKKGCSVILRKQSDGSFAGGTRGKQCPSDRKGAAYATSEVTITPERLLSWDRGYNEKDEQVWGAEKGGYEFIKSK